MCDAILTNKCVLIICLLTNISPSPFKNREKNLADDKGMLIFNYFDVPTTFWSVYEL